MISFKSIPKSVENCIKEYLEYNSITGIFIWRKHPKSGKFRCGERAGVLMKYKKYRSIQFKSIPIMEHRLAWFIYYGYWPTFLDHINGIKDDNRIDNLRECTQGQNRQNTRKKNFSKTKYKGVAKHKKSSKYLAQIHTKEKMYYLGTFVTQEEAARAYDKKAKELYGEFAKLNNV